MIDGWNHRVLRRTHDGEVMFSIHEVYYDEDGNPVGWTVEPVGVTGDTWKEAGEAWMLMHKAFDRPVLDVVDDKLVERTDHG